MRAEEVRVVEEDQELREVEEEWPSLRLESEGQSEEVRAEEVRVVEEDQTKVVEEKSQNLNEIPGLETTELKSDLKKFQRKSKLIPNVDDSSSLGELRFKEE